MKEFLMFIMFLCSYNINSQISTTLNSKGKVNYDIIMNFKNHKVYKGLLYFNDSNSYYIYRSMNSKKTETVSETKDNYNTNLNINVTKPDSTSYIVLTDRKTRIIKSSVKEFKTKKMFFVEDTLPNLNWKLENETKLIGTIVCKKASTRFKGRNYIAWYTPEIYSFFGPIKFGQLPGLIIELYDLDKKLFIQATKISYPFEKAIHIDENYEYITKEKFENNQDKQMDEIQKEFEEKINIALLKLGRDVNISNVKIETKIKEEEQIEINDNKD